MLGFWVPRSLHRLTEKTPATMPVSLLWHLLPQGGHVGWLNHFLARNARKGLMSFAGVIIMDVKNQARPPSCGPMKTQCETDNVSARK